MDTHLQRRLAVRAQLVAARGNADLWRRIVQRAAKAENVRVTKSHGGSHYVLSLFGRTASSSQSEDHAAINRATQVLMRDGQPAPAGDDEDDDREYRKADNRTAQRA